MERHYNFREHLIRKSEEYGSEVIVVTEEFTSQTCGNCFRLSKNYNNRIKHCDHCKFEIDRDLSASRTLQLVA